MENLRIATRESQLALWQAEEVSRHIKMLYPELNVELIPMTTKGDQILHASLAKIGGKGLFIKELETAMLENRADIAVHSMKDVSAELPDGFEIVAILPRENPFDAWISDRYDWENLPENPLIGTCSVRRQMQLKRIRPDIHFFDLRGNLHTRLKKLPRFDGIVLACAGLMRLNLSAQIRQELPLIPAVGQGAIGIECHRDNPFFKYLQVLNHPATSICVHTERLVSRALNASCQVPLGVFAQLLGDEIKLRVCLGSLDGKQFIYLEENAPIKDAESLAEKIITELFARGATEILSQCAL